MSLTFNPVVSAGLRSIVNVMRNSGCEVPAWMLSLKAPSQNQKKQLRQRPVKRKDVSRATGSVGGGKGSRRKPADAGKKGERSDGPGKVAEGKAKRTKPGKKQKEGGRTDAASSA